MSAKEAEMDDLHDLEQWVIVQRQRSDARADTSRNQKIRSKVLAEVWGEIKRRMKEQESRRGEPSARKGATD